jgi:hypothetical protein
MTASERSKVAMLEHVESRILSPKQVDKIFILCR